MAQAFLCDGCGDTDAGGDFTRLGIMVPLDYCAKCARVVGAYLDDRDELHTRIAREFEEGAKALKDAMLVQHPGMELPDDF